MNMAIKQAEYIWLDGATPVQRLRSKSRIVASSAKDPTDRSFPRVVIRWLINLSGQRKRFGPATEASQFYQGPVAGRG
jgi:hypothetical protein